MLNFRNTNIIFALLLGILLWLGFNYDISSWYYIIPVLAYSLILFWGCYNVRSGFFIKTLCAGSTGRKEIALSFDDGPSENYTPQILAILKQYDITAAFFCIGRHITGNEDLLRKVHEAGHIIGNHSYSHHALLDLFPEKKLTDDLRQMDEVVLQTIGLRPALFRPPYGVTNPTVKKAVENRGYHTIGWSIRSLDTVIKNEQKLFKRVTRSVKPGDIILFHDTSKTTVDILQRFIDAMHQHGYTFVRLDKLLNVQPYA